MLHRRAALSLLAGLAACRRGRILSHEEYADIEHDMPYVLRFAREDGALLFFGAKHIDDAGDAQVARIAALWAEFRPTLAFNEGGDPPVEASLVTAAARFGESGLVRFLARRDGVPAASIEPSMRAQVEALRTSGFSDEQILVFFVLRQVPQHRARAGVPMDEARLVEVLRHFHAATGISAPATADELASASARLLPPLRHWSEAPAAWFDPVFTRPAAFTNAANRRVSQVRDAWVVELLADRMRRGERVFATMGASHVVMQEPALRARLGRPERLA
ncbi:hypothetical protein SAMN02745121_01398 [Nannocystis exedens]|uniref:TraB/GumN family protein n=1 Tax=Nannocystis exedens TaxID=54 RepID=A0A1I1UYP6_9BACT|nr:hypothetical protein [Nannocystis exedens]PCC72189.1 hypothetical protein NAEX_05268 [Nannocystis exedens]SFD75685.1 hypothetical protein SAMN02745121_01398 [Nannocystis exedens]